MSKGPSLKVTSDFTERFNETIQKFKNDQVLVGIPAADPSRKASPEGKTAGINNATILAINEFGSPKNNIPARPVMAIGIRNAQAQIAEEFKKAVAAALTTGFAAMEIYYDRAGSIAANSVKKAINSQEGIAPPSEATLAARKRAGFSGTKSLLVTAQMRNAITWVVKGKG